MATNNTQAHDATTARTTARTVAEQLNAAVEAAPLPEVIAEPRLSVRQRLADYAKLLPPGVWPRLQTVSKVVEQLGRQILKMRAPLVYAAKADVRANRGRITRLDIIADVGIDTMIQGLSALTKSENGAEVVTGAVLKVAPSDGSLFSIDVPTDHGLITVGHWRLKNVELEYTPVEVEDTGRDKKRPILDPQFVAALHCDRKVVNMHEALADALGRVYQPKQ